MTKVTKKAVAEYVRHKLKTDKKWAIAAMLKIYEYQTADEQAMRTTNKFNGVGFSGAHAEIMSSFVDHYKANGWLSPKQMAVVFKTIHKYTRQIISVSDQTKLETIVSRRQEAG